MGAGRSADRSQDHSNDCSLDQLNTRLDHISSNIHPIAPFMLTIPSQSPVEFNNEQQRLFWVRGTLFDTDEGQLQYMSNFKDWNTSIIQPIGGWDDGNGGIAQHESSPAYPQPMSHPPPKRIKLGDYTKKKAVNEREQDDADQPMSTKLTNNRIKITTNDLVMREVNVDHAKKEPTERIDLSSRKASLLSSNERTHESRLPVEDLPPPLTPLPPRLAAAVAEFRQHQASNATGQERPTNREVPAADAFYRYQNAQDRLTETSRLADRRHLVTLKFRKRQRRYTELVEKKLVFDDTRFSVPQALGWEAVSKLREFGLGVFKEARSLENVPSAALLQMEGILCVLTAIGITSLGGADIHEQWEIAIRLLSEFADRHLKNSANSQANTQEAVQEFDLLGYLIDSMMSVVHRELSECGMNRLNGTKSSEDMAVWARSEAFQYALRASRRIGVKKISTAYPKVWEDSTDITEQKHENDHLDWTSVVLKGPFCLPLANGRMLEAVRGARRLLMRFCYESGSEPPDHLGAFAAKRDAAI